MTTKNTHLSHLEDLVFEEGFLGASKAIQTLRNLSRAIDGTEESRHSLTVKWDGSPSIVAGINPENGRFFVGTKSALNLTPLVAYDSYDLAILYSGQPKLLAILQTCLRCLPKLNMKGIYQGDLMFSYPSDLRIEKIDGLDHVIMQPNIVAYAIPCGTSLANRVLTASLGIVWHTQYKGTKLTDLKASFHPDISGFTQTDDVWFRDASYTNLPAAAPFTQDQRTSFLRCLNQAAGAFMSVTDEMCSRLLTKDTIANLKMYVNSRIRAGSDTLHANDYAIWLFERDMVKTEKIKKQLGKDLAVAKARATHAENLSGSTGREFQILFDVYAGIAGAKNVLIQKLAEFKTISTFISSPTGLKASKHEGFVAIDLQDGSAVKLVDRLEFSTANFAGPRSKTLDPQTTYSTEVT